ncbi:MAG: hypothetical protein IT285_00005, partial [Bdellovibrionales bacterium]|nr:hypothetical protein [Bdellovibrionales bacterium]
ERFAARGAAVTPDVQNQRVDVLLTIPSSDDGREAREFRMSVFLLARIPVARGRRAGSPRYSVTPRVFAEVVRVENGVYGLDTESESDVLSLINEILEVLPTCVPHP